MVWKFLWGRAFNLEDGREGGGGLGWIARGVKYGDLLVVAFMEMKMQLWRAFSYESSLSLSLCLCLSLRG